jgi:hypothetical protein
MLPGTLPVSQNNVNTLFATYDRCTAFYIKSFPGLCAMLDD